MNISILIDNQFLFISFYFFFFSLQLLSTQAEVSKLQEDLETMQPLLAQAAKETEETMLKIKEDSVSRSSVVFS